MDRQTLFALYFSGLAGWRYHPGYTRKDSIPPSIEECAKLAAYMVRITEESSEWLGVLPQVQQ